MRKVMRCQQRPSPLGSQMLRLLSAASGEELAALDASEFDALADRGSTVGALKRHLAASHFEGKYTRFQLRILRGAEELQDGEVIELPMDLQLIVMNHLPPDEERDERFAQSCGGGEVDEVERSLRALQDPNVSDGGSEVGSGGSVLCFAALRGHFDVVRLLLEAGAKTELHDFAGSSPLHHAAAYGDLEIARLLLDYGAKKEAVDRLSCTPMHMAARRGHAAVVRLLAGAGQELVDGMGKRPLHLAAEEGHVDVVRLLVAQMEVADGMGRRPLHWAALRGHVSVVDLLLASRCESGAEDHQGSRPLHLAAAEGRVGVAQSLLAHGADGVKAAYDVACASGHFEVAQVLRRKRRVQAEGLRGNEQAVGTT